MMGVLFLLNALTLIPFPWNTPLENLSIDWRFKVRGCRSVPDDIVLVFVGPEDLQALGGWPLTRDYYGYFLHVLGEQQARAIGLDLLFNTPDQRYPEYDQRLADFMETTRPIVLPMVYSDLNSRAPDRDNFPPNVLQGENPLLPLPRFRHAISGLGFSNLGDESLIRKLPLISAEGDSFRLSFGAELARIYLGIAHDSVTVTR
ncbi:CHASE2 domain-containing protein, partial [candidate division KSB1 bacterium]|nr:CHASE2 domain-containing protein [candidate division KSB1 bacterium]